MYWIFLYFIMIPLLHFLCLPIDFAEVELTFSSGTTTGTSYYLGEPLTVSWKVSSIPQRLRLDIIIGDYSVHCQHFTGGSWLAGTSGDKPNDLYYLALANEDCDLPGRDNTIAVNFNLTRGSESLPMTCYEPISDKTATDSLTIGVGEIKGKSN